MNLADLIYIILDFMNLFLPGFVFITLFRWLNAKFVKEFLYKTHNKSVNDDIFDDIVDYEKPMMMSVYIKSSEIYYVGQFCFREKINGFDQS